MELQNKSKILVENIKVLYKPGMSAADIDRIALRKAHKKISAAFDSHGENLAVYRKSLDARRRDSIKFVFSVCAQIDARADKREFGDRDIRLCVESDFSVNYGSARLESRPIVVGFGPAGIFCALALAKHGYCPIVYERGENVDKRVASVERFYKNHALNPLSNIQFGAGGAGTFSDGKLMTRINDPLCSYVLSELVSLGAPQDIMSRARPHVGTDILRNVVAEADRCLESLGGEIHYNTKVSVSRGGLYADGVKLPSQTAVLALGHSARDTYAELIDAGFLIEPKPYSAGVRIEHLQSELDAAMLGDFAGDETLGHAEYNLSERVGERGVYSFCMCPGGEVVAAASEEGGVVTNGMSRHARDGKNANAAIAVSVLPSDYGNTPIGAIEFQRSLESAAFAFGGGDYTAPMQTVGDFLNGKYGSEPTVVSPTYMGGRIKSCDLHNILPSFITDMLETGLRSFGKKIYGFDRADIPMTGVETRTSSPVRIMRDRDTLEAVGHSGIYPCGEGAGYAGGIISAAVDGLRAARAIMEKYAPFDA